MTTALGNDPLAPRRRPPPSIQITALIDVVFILLAFVVLAANFDRIKAMKLALPQAASAAPAPQAPLIVEILKPGGLRVANKPLGDGGDLEATLRGLRATHPSLLVVADGAVSLKRTVRVLDAAARAGFDAVSVAAEPSRRAPEASP